MRVGYAPGARTPLTLSPSALADRGPRPPAAPSSLFHTQLSDQMGRAEIAPRGTTAVRGSRDKVVEAEHNEGDDALAAGDQVARKRWVVRRRDRVPQLLRMSRCHNQNVYSVRHKCSYNATALVLDWYLYGTLQDVRCPAALSFGAFVRTVPPYATPVLHTPGRPHPSCTNATDLICSPFANFHRPSLHAPLPPRLCVAAACPALPACRFTRTLLLPHQVVPP